MPLAGVFLTVDGISFFDGNQFDGNGKTKNAGNISSVLGHEGNFVDGRRYFVFRRQSPRRKTGNTKLTGFLAFVGYVRGSQAGGLSFLFSITSKLRGLM